MPASRYTLTAGLLAATLDIVLAMGFWWWRAAVPPARILQSVASGLLGGTAFTLGAKSAALGAVLHLAMACAMAAVYGFASRRSEAMRYHWVAAGLAYGAVLYGVMTFAVVPLSRAQAVPFRLDWFVASVFAHLVLVGLPLAWLARARR